MSHVNKSSVYITMMPLNDEHANGVGHVRFLEYHAVYNKIRIECIQMGHTLPGNNGIFTVVMLN